MSPDLLGQCAYDAGRRTLGGGANPHRAWPQPRKRCAVRLMRGPETAATLDTESAGIKAHIPCVFSHTGPGCLRSSSLPPGPVLWGPAPISYDRVIPGNAIPPVLHPAPPDRGEAAHSVCASFAIGTSRDFRYGILNDPAREAGARGLTTVGSIRVVARYWGGGWICVSLYRSWWRNQGKPMAAPSEIHATTATIPALDTPPPPEHWWAPAWHGGVARPDGVIGPWGRGLSRRRCRRGRGSATTPRPWVTTRGRGL